MLQKATLHSSIGLPVRPPYTIAARRNRAQAIKACNLRVCMVESGCCWKYAAPAGIKAQRLCQFCDATPRFGQTTTLAGDSSHGAASTRKRSLTNVRGTPTPMTVLRRSLVALGIAAMLPTVVFAAFTVFHMLRQERERVTNAALTQSQVVMTLVDTQLQRHFAALDVLSSSIYFETGDWAEFYWRVQRLLAANRLWESIALIDAQRHEEMFDLGRPFDEPVPLPAGHEEALQRLFSTGTHVVGCIENPEQPVVWLYVPVRSEGKITHVVAASLRLRIFQDLLTAYTGPGSTGAIIDGDDNFIARTSDYVAPTPQLSTRDGTL